MNEEKPSPDETWSRIHLGKARLSRRDLLEKCAALGAISVLRPLSLPNALDAWEAQLPKRPTAWNELGPFYRRGAPNQSQLRRPGDVGLPLRVTGRVLSTR